MSTKNLLKDLLRKAAALPRDLDISLFSEPAQSLLEKRINEFIVHLIHESEKQARLDKVDTVSASHVERASTNMLRRGGGSLSRYAGTIGGILLGTALSGFMGIPLAGDQPLWGLIAIGLSIIGAFGVAWHANNGP